MNKPKTYAQIITSVMIVVVGMITWKNHISKKNIVGKYVIQNAQEDFAIPSFINTADTISILENG